MDDNNQNENPAKKCSIFDEPVYKHDFSVAFHPLFDVNRGKENLGKKKEHNFDGFKYEDETPGITQDIVDKANFYFNVAMDITCAYCGRQQRDIPNIKFEIDHICPIFWGGTDDPENLCDCCRTCNQRKLDKLGRKTLDGRYGKSSWMEFDEVEKIWRVPKGLY